MTIPRLVGIIEYIVRDISKSLSSISETGSPIIPSLLWIWFVWMVKIKMCGMGKNYLFRNKRKNKNNTVESFNFMGTNFRELGGGFTFGGGGGLIS